MSQSDFTEDSIFLVYDAILGCVVPRVLQDHTAFIFRVKYLGLPDREDDGTMILQSVGNHTTNKSASHMKKFNLHFYDSCNTFVYKNKCKISLFRLVW